MNIMRLFLFIHPFLLLFISANAYCYLNVEINKESGRIYMQDESCELIIYHLSKLINNEDASNTLKKTCSSFNDKKSVKESGKLIYQIDLTNLLSKDIRELLLENNDPRRSLNCWNAVLYFNKIIKSIHYTDGEEFSYIINSPLCKELDANKEPLDPLLPGDIGVVAYQSGRKIEQQHAFIYLNDDFVFQKDGPEGKWELTDIVGALLGYKSKVAGAISGAREKQKKDEKKLDMKKVSEINRDTLNKYRVQSLFNFYRCISLDEYLKTKKPSKEAMTLLETIEKEECALNKLAKTNMLNEHSIKQIQKILTIVNAIIEKFSENQNKLKEDDKLIYEMILKRITSMNLELEAVAKSATIKENKN
ncbi:MAG: hypothetical protein HQK51_07815 [Oligoflexia bacterium]|nr:hypothetical protein [Oligoflexia bacterium]